MHNSNPCISCLLDTELNLKTKSLWYSNWAQEEQELIKFLKKVKPQKILEIGVGSGRIINLILKTIPNCKIIGLEHDKDMFDFVKIRFRKIKNVVLKRINVTNYFKSKNKFDLIICAMNTFGNINNSNLFTEIIKHSKYVFVSVYSSKFDKLRRKMCLSRGHKNPKFSDNAYFFNDSWVKGLVSRSFKKEDILKLIKQTSAKQYSIIEKNMLYIVKIQS